MRRVNNNYTIHDKLYSLSLYEIIANWFLISKSAPNDWLNLGQWHVFSDEGLVCFGLALAGVGGWVYYTILSCSIDISHLVGFSWVIFLMKSKIGSVWPGGNARTGLNYQV